MDRNQVDQIVRVVLSTVLKKEIDKEKNIDRDNTPDWDSLKHMQIMFALEDELSVEFSEQDLADLDSINKIVEKVIIHHAA